MQRWTTTVYTELSPEVDVDGCIVPFASRRDGVPCGDECCRYRFVRAPLLKSLDACKRAVVRRAPHRGAVLRIFITLEFRQARTENCTELTYLDERALLNNEPDALAQLRALRDAGVDLILIRGEHARHVGVIFVDAIGSTIVVAEEAPYMLIEGEWSCVNSQRPEDDAQRAITPRPKSLAVLVAWQILVALLVGGVLHSAASVATRISGLAITVSVWLVIAISIPLAIMVGLRMRALVRRLHKIERAAVSTVSRVSQIENGIRDEVEFWRDRAQAELDADHGDEVKASPDDGAPARNR